MISGVAAPTVKPRIPFRTIQTPSCVDASPKALNTVFRDTKREGAVAAAQRQDCGVVAGGAYRGAPLGV